MIPKPPMDLLRERIVSVRGLRYMYPGGVEALRNVNLDIAKGDYVALVGENGSGKTTLAKHFNGLLRPTSGTVTVAGRTATGQTVAELSRIVGYAFQNPDHQLFCSTVEEEIGFGPENLGLPEAEKKRLVEESLELMDLKHLRAAAPLSLRLAEKRKVSIASVLAMNPSAIILDEPTGGLDAREIEDLMAHMRTLNNAGRTIVLISHDMKLVAEHANRVVMMADGRIMLNCDTRGALSDLDSLARSNLVPPPVTQLAHRLTAFGIPDDLLSPEELVFEVLRRGGR